MTQARGVDDFVQLLTQSHDGRLILMLPVNLVLGVRTLWLEWSWSSPASRIRNL
jgi:hypothetical protein